MRSKDLLAAHKSIQYWIVGSRKAIWTRGHVKLAEPAQRQTLRDAEDLIRQAKQKIDGVFGQEIGKAIIEENQ